jgi:hypothetical protein
MSDEAEIDRIENPTVVIGTAVPVTAMDKGLTKVSKIAGNAPS